MTVYTIDHKSESCSNAYAMMAAHQEERPRRLAMKPETNARWSPQISLFENNDIFVIEVLVPGVDPSRISVTLEGSTLVFSGEKGRFGTRSNPLVSGPMGTQRFIRKVKLPVGVDIRKMRAEMKNGLLLISTPKIRRRAA